MDSVAGNAHENGAGGLSDFTFRDTGITVKIRKVSPLLQVQLGRDFPPPKPPMQEVDYGDGEKRLEPNEASPTYLEELKAYKNDLEFKMRSMMIKLGVVCDVDQEAVSSLREFYREEMGKELDPDDKMVYVSYICIGTSEDMQELITAITRRSQPTEESAEAVRDSFPGDVPGQGHLENTPA